MNSIITFKKAYFQNVYSQKEYLLLVKKKKEKSFYFMLIFEMGVLGNNS